MDTEKKSEFKETKTLPEKKQGVLTVDIYQTDDDVIIKSTLAGVTSNELDISVTNDMVTIKGHRQVDKDIKESDYYYRELYWGAFSRSIVLPVDIDSDKATASMKNGILTIRLPKIEKTRKRRLTIET